MKVYGYEQPDKYFMGTNGGVGLNWSAGNDDVNGNVFKDINIVVLDFASRDLQ